MVCVESKSLATPNYSVSGHNDMAEKMENKHSIIKVRQWALLQMCLKQNKCCVGQTKNLVLIDVDCELLKCTKVEHKPDSPGHNDLHHSSGNCGIHFPNCTCAHGNVQLGEDVLVM